MGCLLSWRLGSWPHTAPAQGFVPAPLPTAAPPHTNCHLNVNQVRVAQLCSQVPRGYGKSRPSPEAVPPGLQVPFTPGLEPARGRGRGPARLGGVQAPGLRCGRRAQCTWPTQGDLGAASAGVVTLGLSEGPIGQNQLPGPLLSSRPFLSFLSVPPCPFLRRPFPCISCWAPLVLHLPASLGLLRLILNISVLLRTLARGAGVAWAASLSG